MSNVVVIGSQWGDEGKGKVVDWLSERADVIVRFQGGHNAGHTLVVDGTVYKLSLLPSGVVRPGKLSIIGNGVVIDPWELLKEINKIRGQGVDITNQNLKIAENAALILPIHSHLDKAAEAYRGGKKIGTTGRGIGPAYEDKIARRAIRLCDLADDALLNEKLDNMLFHHNSLIRGFGQEEMKKEDILAPLMEIREELLSFAAPVWMLLEDARRREKRILFEGAQGTMLDVDHGTYPFVTSSNTVAGMASAGSGIGVGHVGYVLGITKAYTTRVGSGPFPTEQDNEIGRYLGEKGHEFGTVTGRKRRCGWFDAVMVRQAVKLSGMHGICLTKLDVLDGMEELNICVGYELNGERLTHFPAGQHIQGELTPIYETMPGWSESTMHARSWAELPAAAVKYAKRIEELIDAPIALLSTSPEREDMIRMTDPFQP